MRKSLHDQGEYLRGVAAMIEYDLSNGDYENFIKNIDLTVSNLQLAAKVARLEIINGGDPEPQNANHGQQARGV